MKTILITGKNSYIGTSIEKWLSQPKFRENYLVDTIDVRGAEWKKLDFSQYYAVIHVAGIAHRKETKENAHLYYEVNRDLAIDIAGKAEREGIKQFIILSTMNVYGLLEGAITKNTIPNPSTNYGKAKLEADAVIGKMNNRNFKVASVRPPMIYGKDCKGNYPKLSFVARHSLFFLSVKNKRSMLYIENLCDFIEQILHEEKSGIFHPQNNQFVCTETLVKKIAKCHNHLLICIPFIAPIIKGLAGDKGKKVLGTLVYDMEEDRCGLVSFEDSIEQTEIGSRRG